MAMAETKTRNQYLDIMKGLLITLVVIGHLPFFEYDSRTLTLIYSFHMHAFVIIGGLLSHVNENTKISTIINILNQMLLNFQTNYPPPKFFFDP